MRAQVKPWMVAAAVLVAGGAAQDSGLTGPQQRELLGELETALNELAVREGELRLSVPMAYIEAAHP